MDFTHIPAASKSSHFISPPIFSLNSDEIEGQNAVQSLQSLNLKKDYMNSFVRNRISKEEEEERGEERKEKKREEDGGEEKEERIENGGVKKDDRRKREEKEGKEELGEKEREGGKREGGIRRESIQGKMENFLGERKCSIVVEGVIFKEEKEYLNSEICKICGSEFSMMKLRKKNW